MKNPVSGEFISQRIFLIRGQKVMLSHHLAQLYGVETRLLIQAVKRNIERFPSDFIFQLNSSEYRLLKSQIVISSWGGFRRARPYAFTEQGVAMLSSVLRSRRAIQVNIAIMRTFIKLKSLLLTHKDLERKLKALEKKYAEHDEKIQSIFEAIKQLLEPGSTEEKRIIGFTAK